MMFGSFTYISQAHGTTSWLDHCITTVAGRSLITNAYITDNVICSDHFPLTVKVLEKCTKNLIGHSRLVFNNY